MVERITCRHCGAPLEKGVQECTFCSARVRALDRVGTILCGRCFTRLPGTARFCSFCQKALAPQECAPTPEGYECPRCGDFLQRRTVEGGYLDECPGCGGLWLDPDTFNRLCQQTVHERETTLTGPRQQLVTELKDTHPMGYLACPTCRDMMVRRNFGGRSGIIIDVCRGHGVWLDLTEWERVREYILAGGPRWV